MDGKEALNFMLFSTRPADAPSWPMLERARAYVTQLERERDEAVAEAAAVRELMNTYNLGGWTDAIGPMKRALAAEADLAALRAQPCGTHEASEEMIAAGCRTYDSMVAAGRHRTEIVLGVYITADRARVDDASQGEDFWPAIPTSNCVNPAHQHAPQPAEPAGEWTREAPKKGKPVYAEFTSDFEVTIFCAEWHFTIKLPAVPES